MIVDPWGVVMAQAADTECFVSADLDFTIQNEMRNSLPCLRHRRPDAYRWPEDEPPTRRSRRRSPSPRHRTGAP